MWHCARPPLTPWQVLAAPCDQQPSIRPLPLAPNAPVRVQRRAGALWMLNSAALAAAGLGNDAPDGRLFRADALLRSRVPRHPIDLTAMGRLLARQGVTGVTDATPNLDPDAV